jgi:hypothetical protein
MTIKCVLVRILKEVFTEMDHTSHANTEGNSGKHVSIASGLAETPALSVWGIITISSA